MCERWRLLRKLAKGKIHVGTECQADLAKLRRPECIPSLVRLLRHRDDSVRESVAFVLGGTRDKRSMQALIGALSDLSESEGVRTSAAIALGNIGDPIAIGALLEGTNDTIACVRRFSLHALGQLRAPQALDLAIKMLASLDSDERKTAIEVLGKLSQPSGALPVVKVWESLDWYQRGMAARALEQMSYPGLVDLLLKELARARDIRRQVSEGVFELRCFEEAACEILGRLREARAVELLIAEMRDYDSTILDSAARALTLIGGAAVEQLIKLLDPRQPGVRDFFVLSVRAAASKSLGKIGDKRAVNPLREALNDAEMREYAAEALRELGT